MIKAIARFAAAAVAAVALALGAAGTAGAAFHPPSVPVYTDACTQLHPGSCGTWESADGNFLAVVGSPARPATSTATKFTKQTGTGFETSWYFFHPSQFAGDNGAVAQWSNDAAAEVQHLYLAALPNGDLVFTHVQDASTEWIFTGSCSPLCVGQFVNGLTGQALDLQAHGVISTVPAGGSQPGTQLEFVLAS